MIKTLLKKVGIYKYLVDIGLTVLRHAKLNKVEVNFQGVKFWTDYSTVASERAFNTIPAMREEMSGFIKFSKGRNALLDIGAYHGVFSLLFSKLNHDSKVLAVEPSPKAQRVINLNLDYNTDLKIELMMKGLGANPGLVNANFEGQHVVVAEKGMAIELSTVDQLVYEKGYQFDTLKIDVEGYELKVLEGASKFLDQSNPIIFLEVHPKRLLNMDDSTEKLYKYLSQKGFFFFDNHGSRIETITASDESRIICSKSNLC